MTTDLPPPAIFTHDETLHRILLPPLATFLSALRAPHQLVKLNDILTRFRTPKSYHRVDVRLVQSSELPPHDWEEEKDDSAEGRGDSHQHREGDGAPRDREVVTPYKVEQEITPERRARWKKEKGEPIVLPDGLTVEQYLMEHPRAVPGSDKTTATPAIEIEEECVTAAPVQRRETGPAAATREAAVDNGDTPDVLQANEEEAVTMIQQETITAVRAPSVPIVTEHIHPLPPSGPPRRVRELRLDLRTLDAAALFALETWRREIMGLERLPMDHPDSIWYKDPTPSPPPAPPASSSKRRGRPPKIRRKSSESAYGGGNGFHAGHEVKHPVDGQGDEVEGRNDRDGEAPARDRAETLAPDEEVDGQVKSTAEFEDGSLVDEVTPSEQAFAEVMEGDMASNTNHEINEATVAEEATEEVESEGEEEIDPLLDRSLSPSPDIILSDLYDRKDALDPEFVPPPPKVQRGIRTAQAGEAGFRRGRGGGRGNLSRPTPPARVRIDLSPEKAVSTMAQPRERDHRSSSDFAMDDSDAPIDLTGVTDHAAAEPIVARKADPGFRPMTFIDITKPRPHISVVLSPPPQSAVRVSSVKRRRVLLESVNIDTPARRLKGPRRTVHFAVPEVASPARAVSLVKKAPVVIEIDDDSDEDDEILEIKRGPSKSRMTPKEPVTAMDANTSVPVPERRPEDDEEWGFLL